MRALALLVPAPVLLFGLLTACNSKTPADDAPMLAPTSRSDAGAVAAAAEAAGSGIPRVLQGRWGLTPADCEPDRADAKGLLVMDGDSLEFYESVAQLGKVERRTTRGIRAHFSMNGEGLSWQREMDFAAGDGGQTMTRREFGEDAAPGPLVYTRCS